MAFTGKVKAGGNTGPVGSTLYGLCTTAANVAAKEVTISELDTLITGLTIHVKFTNANRAEQPTLTIPSVDSVARRIYRHGAVSPGVTDREAWYAGAVVSLTFDGTAWEMNDWQSDTTYGNASTSAAGLMSATDKLALDNIRTKRTTSLVFEGLSTTTWTEENPKTYASYPYTAEISCPGVTANHFAQVCFNPEDVVNYVPCPVCQTGNGIVKVWMMIKPGNALTVPTVFAILPDRT